MRQARGNAHNEVHATFHGTAGECAETPFLNQLEQTVEQAIRARAPGHAAVFFIEAGNREGAAVLAEIEPRRLLHPAGAEELVRRVRTALAREHGIQLHLLLLLRAPARNDLIPNESQQATGAPLDIAVSDIITPCGAPGAETLVVLRGTIEVRTLVEGRDYPLAILGPGQASGAQAVLWCAPGASAVVALTAGHVAVLSATPVQRRRNGYVAKFTRVLSISRSWSDDLGSDPTRADATAWPRFPAKDAVAVQGR